MNLNPYCMCCQINKQEQRIRQFDDEERKVIYMKEILRRFAEATDTDCAPSLSVEFQKYFSDFWGVPSGDYTEVKKDFNSLMLSLENRLRQTIHSTPDPLESALIHARIGNYIDFAALANVDKEEMLSLIESENKDTLDPLEYQNFRKEMAHAKSLVYLTDNCGEIVLDKLAVEVLKEQFPDTEITVIVRGEPVVNDATMEDAEEVGLTSIVKVIGNGNNVGGTWLPGINKETRALLDCADVILAKGQGNFETLHDCGMNIYYLFLCKCQRFTDMFQAKPLQGMFVNERRVSSK